MNKQEETIVREIEKNKLFSKSNKSYSLGKVFYQNDVPTEIREFLPKGKPQNEELLDYLRGNESGGGKPDLTIKYNDLQNSIVIFEFKKDVRLHSTIKMNQPKNYSVDGVLYYAKYLKEKFNVIAIAVSGDEEHNIVVDHYKWNKGSETYEEGWSILDMIPNVDKEEVFDIDVYRQILLGIEIQDPLNQVREIALELHNKLRELGFTEKQKPLFVANLLMFVSEDREANWEDYEYDKLVDRIRQKLKQKLANAEVNKNNTSSFLNALNEALENRKLRNNTIKGESNNIYYYLEKFRKEILTIYETLPGIELDPMGEFYNEFIKYSGGDGKGLGIVLTPFHITKFMAKLINVDRTSKVLDIACGTGSFLVASKTLGVKNDNLFGIEINKELQNLAIANMIVHKDGKSNIKLADAFEDDSKWEEDAKNSKTIIETLKDKEIDKVLINPPYSQWDHSELSFVQRALDIMKPGGELAVIAPLSTAIGTKFKSERLSLFKNHKLKAVFTMPIDLFYPAASTNTCIMIWESKKPHVYDEEVFFGIYKDDGYVKDKKVGRTDKNGVWEIFESEFLNIYKERKVIPGKTVTHKVNHDDEWLAEAYVETDYSSLSEENFGRVVKEFASFKLKFNNSFSKNYTKEQFEKEKNKWKKFNVNDLFDTYEKGKVSNSKLLDDGKGYYYVGAKKNENGVMKSVSLKNDKELITKGNCIAWIRQGEGSSGYATYQPDDFYGASTLQILRNNNFNKYHYIFAVAVIDLEFPKYNFGRALSAKSIANTEIRLPAVKVNGEWKPDLDKMEEIIKSQKNSNSI